MKILIVDDEALIKQKLERIVQSVAHGIHKVMAFSDPREALNCIDRERPEIVLTDIRMPGITGIDLARHINEKKYRTKVIFLTGYSDFQYAQAGIQYHVYDYLLKPVDEGKAAECVKGAMAALLAERKRNEMYQIFQNYFTENLEVIRQQFMQKLLFHPMFFNKNQIELQKQKLQISISGYRILVGTYRGDHLTFEEESYYGYQVMQSLRKKWGEALAMENGGLVYVIWPDEGNSLWSLCEKLEKAKHELEKDYPIFFQVGVSRYSDDFQEIYSLKRQALRCLEYGREAENSGIITYKELSKEKEADKYFDVTEAITELIRLLQMGQKEQMSLVAERILQEAESSTDLQFDSIMELICANVILFLSSISLTQSARDQILDSYQGQLLVQSSRKLKGEYLLYWLGYIADHVRSMEKDDQNQLIQAVFQYISEKFSEPIGLTNVSEYVNRNPSYISRLIKQRTGKNFSQILQERRLEEAKKLLRTTSLKVPQIAQQVGYPNLQYFTRVFSSQMNMTPNEYRKIATYF